MIKQIKTFILICILSFTCITRTYATTAISAEQSDIHINDLELSSPSCFLMDAKTGEILYAKNAYDSMYPASTTKLMTAILTLEKCQLTDVATVSHNAIYSIPVGYSHAYLKEGEQLTIEQLLNILLIPSANDAAIVLAEHISGSVSEFSKLMNEKARELGCKNTNFVNPNGIHSKDHLSTAYDLALIGQYAMQFPDIMRISMAKEYTLPATNKYDKADRTFETTNVLINNSASNKNYYPYATGLKTGYTDSSGYCIVTSARKGDMQLVAVILKASSSDARSEDCKKLFDYGFNNYSYVTLHSPDKVIETIEIPNSNTKLDVTVKEEIKFLLKKGMNSEEVKPTIEIASDLQTPIEKNAVVGTIAYTIEGLTYSYDLIAFDGISRTGMETFIFRIALIILILYIVYVLLRLSSKNGSSGRPSPNLKKKKKTSRHKQKGNFKFTQINHFL